jgi:hypothetical protein
MVKEDLVKYAEELREIMQKGSPIEQAQAFQLGRNCLLSNRKIAGMAGCSEAHVRNMLILLNLPAVDQQWIADGEPYRCFLAGSKEASQGSKPAPPDMESAVSKGCACLRNWCKQLELSGGYAERALKEAKVQIQWAEDRREIPQSDVMWRATPEEAFELFRRPDYMQLTGFRQIYAASVWLALSLVYLMPNSEARRKALEMSLVEASGSSTS